MSDAPEQGQTPASGGKKPRGHHDDRGGPPRPERARNAPRPTHSGKTMHHPAFRIGEIKRGK